MGRLSDMYIEQESEKYESETEIGKCPHGKPIIYYKDATPGFKESYSYCRCNACIEDAESRPGGLFGKPQKYVKGSDHYAYPE